MCAEITEGIVTESGGWIGRRCGRIECPTRIRDIQLTKIIEDPFFNAIHFYLYLIARVQISAVHTQCIAGIFSVGEAVAIDKNILSKQAIVDIKKELVIIGDRGGVLKIGIGRDIRLPLPVIGDLEAYRIEGNRLGHGRNARIACITDLHNEVIGISGNTL